MIRLKFYPHGTTVPYFSLPADYLIYVVDEGVVITDQPHAGAEAVGTVGELVQTTLKRAFRKVYPAFESALLHGDGDVEPKGLLGSELGNVHIYVEPPRMEKPTVEELIVKIMRQR